MKYIFSLLVLSLIAPLYSQSDTIVIPSVNGPAGNYIYLVNLQDVIDGKSSLDDEYIIERLELSTLDTEVNSKDLKSYAKYKTAQSYKELESIYGKSGAEDLRKQMGNLSKKEAFSKLINSPLDSIAFLYGFVETKIALGHVYFDDKVKANYYYMYRVYKKSKDADKRLIGYAYCYGGAGNYTLDYLKPQWKSAEGKDSMVMVEWVLPMIDSPTDEFEKKNISTIDGVNNTIQNLPFLTYNLRARVMVNGPNGFEQEAIITPTKNENSDTLIYTYEAANIGAEQVSSYLLLQDEVYNVGVPSDTALVFPYDSTTADIIYSLNVIDTLNGIYIEWNKLPDRPYYTGIEILKYNSRDELDTVAILAPDAKSYLDRSVEVGQYYRYQVKALFVPQKGLIQRVAAQGTGTFSKFTKPLPPFNLKASTLDQYINLEWEVVDEPSIYGYYVYRGTTNKNLELAAGPIFEKNFTDSLTSLSGRSFYTYAVSSQNYAQDTSQYSNLVSIRPDKSISTFNAPSVNIYYANKTMRLDWKDVRAHDNIIESYILERKVNENGEYVRLNADALTKPSYIDEDVVAGNTYYYRVASVSTYGDITEFSEASLYKVQKSKVPTINKFYARNVTGGVKTTIPSMNSDSRKAYNIYRKKAEAEDFSLLASIPANESNYLDTNIVKGEYYVYVITLILEDNREGSRGKSVTVRVK